MAHTVEPVVATIQPQEGDPPGGRMVPGKVHQVELVVEPDVGCYLYSSGK